MNERIEIIKKFIERVRTKEEYDELLSALSVLEGNAYLIKGFTLDSLLDTRLPYRISRMLREIVQGGVFGAGAEALQGFLSELKKKLAEIEVLKIDVAIEPSEEFIDRLHQWVLRELGANFLFDIRRDASILGGIRLIYGGRYKELTLKGRIKEVCDRQRKIILKMVLER